MRSLLIVALSASPAWAAEPVLAPGFYGVAVQMTMPNVELQNNLLRTEVCWRGPDDPAMPLGPLGPGPLRDCPSVARESEGSLAVETTCPGRNAGVAVSIYRATPEGFAGRVEMNLGGKNMTAGETHRGVRLGECPDAP